VLALADLDAAAHTGLAERIRLNISEQDWDAVTPGLRGTASVGVARGDAAGWGAVLAAADAAMLAAKQSGRNAVSSVPKRATQPRPGTV
jgi:PleD family two-component response regulator